MINRPIPVIYYHSIAPNLHKYWFRRYLTLALKYFELQLKYFYQNGYKYINLYDLYAHNCGDEEITGKAVCLTFDDGFVDNFIYVFPILKKYRAKGTIFINPEFVDQKNAKRKTLDDYWNNRVTYREIETWGYLSWDEMREMSSSGLIDIQSHTLTHTKYFVSDKLIGFHHPGGDCLYPVGNLYPERKPYYIEDTEFERLIPYGYPFFEEKSAVIARKVEINPDFIQESVELLDKEMDWKTYNFDTCFQWINPIYKRYHENSKLILKQESEESYKDRVREELQFSKETIEKELEKPVQFCCWPHGDNNEFAHQTALQLGYIATTVGNNSSASDVKQSEYTRIPQRIGLTKFNNSLFLSRLKTRYKIGSYEKRFPYYEINRLYNLFRYGLY